MLFKLLRWNLKGRIKDYLILFSGLLISSSVFYMFQTLARNRKLIATVTSGSNFQIIFQIGSVLLGVITLIYLLFANTFLLQLNTKNYGLFMLLGARKGKIRELVAGETLAIGVLATGSGILLGIVLTNFVQKLLLHALEIKGKLGLIFDLQSLGITALFFLVSFALIVLFNVHTVTKKVC
ncbi:FtsX-like permease family protein [Lactobacillus sp. DCY120]|uniref:FtsX-like permease family protein n=1 Tax=Bombilactobacillus apium TaxID=2675299 RepID=A0A850R5S1_9LACO|nr:FtsX-like permease family protein [Bombilactobacillus apium]NVY95962.1 FtsX-like permease family protein [Bombilactobacillus apium]